MDATMGRPTKGAWPINWIHHRAVIVAGRPVSSGMTPSDITIHTQGPYTAAAAATPPGDRMADRNVDEPDTSSYPPHLCHPLLL